VAPSPAPHRPLVRAAGGPPRDLTAAIWATFGLLGVVHLLLPTLIRQVQETFGEDDAGIGGAYFLYSLLYVAGAFLGGALAARGGRRVVVVGGPAMLAVGTLTCGLAPSWPVFLAGVSIIGVGGGLVDMAMNALVLELTPGRSTAALNRLHLILAIGALAGPLLIGWSVAGGMPWTWAYLIVAACTALSAVGLATRRLPPAPRAGGRRERSGGGLRARLLIVPLSLFALSVAIGANIATESGISSWLVRYLAAAPLEVATLSLSLFWAGLALGRLLGALIGDRLPPVGYAAGSSLACAVAVLVAVALPVLPGTIAAFALAGLAIGPIYPTIMSIAGSLHPGRAGLVSSVLSAAAVVGSLIYPPLMGILSEAVGLGVGMVGAALCSFLAAAAILLAPVAARRERPAGA